MHKRDANPSNLCYANYRYKCNIKLKECRTNSHVELKLNKNTKLMEKQGNSEIILTITDWKQFNKLTMKV